LAYICSKGTGDLDCVPTLRWLEIYGFHAGRYAINGCFRKYWVFTPNHPFEKEGVFHEKKTIHFGGNSPILGNTQMVKFEWEYLGYTPEI